MIKEAKGNLYKSGNKLRKQRQQWLSHMMEKVRMFMANN